MSNKKVKILPGDYWNLMYSFIHIQLLIENSLGSKDRYDVRKTLHDRLHIPEFLTYTRQGGEDYSANSPDAITSPNLISSKISLDDRVVGRYKTGVNGYRFISTYISGIQSIKQSIDMLVKAFNSKPLFDIQLDTTNNSTQFLNDLSKFFDKFEIKDKSALDRSSSLIQILSTFVEKKDEILSILKQYPPSEVSLVFDDKYSDVNTLESIIDEEKLNTCVGFFGGTCLDLSTGVIYLFSNELGARIPLMTVKDFFGGLEGCNEDGYVQERIDNFLGYRLASESDSKTTISNIDDWFFNDSRVTAGQGHTVNSTQLQLTQKQVNKITVQVPDYQGSFLSYFIKRINRTIDYTNLYAQAYASQSKSTSVDDIFSNYFNDGDPSTDNPWEASNELLLEQFGGRSVFRSIKTAFFRDILDEPGKFVSFSDFTNSLDMADRYALFSTIVSHIRLALLSLSNDYLSLPLQLQGAFDYSDKNALTRFKVLFQDLISKGVLTESQVEDFLNSINSYLTGPDYVEESKSLVNVFPDYINTVTLDNPDSKHYFNGLGLYHYVQGDKHYKNTNNFDVIGFRQSDCLATTVFTPGYDSSVTKASTSRKFMLFNSCNRIITPDIYFTSMDGYESLLIGTKRDILASQIDFVSNSYDLKLDYMNYENGTINPTWSAFKYGNATLKASAKVRSQLGDVMATTAAGSIGRKKASLDAYLAQNLPRYAFDKTSLSFGGSALHLDDNNTLIPQATYMEELKAQSPSEFDSYIDGRYFGNSGLSFLNSTLLSMDTLLESTRSFNTYSKELWKLFTNLDKI